MKNYILIKKMLDFIFAFIAILVLSPIMLIISLAIIIDSKGGPVLFKQRRPGKNAVVFTVYKFRTMRNEIERNGAPLSDMVRMTRVGKVLRKFSLDELPQLFNIIRGEMSFIGPRPLLVQYLDLYSPEQMRRHNVTPGISGWAQVNGRNAISWEKKFEYDVWYVDNLSALIDLKILYMTICNVIKRQGVNNSDGDTMPFFKGSR